MLNFNLYFNVTILQCWVILAKLREVWVPVAWFLLPSKEYKVYRECLLFLKTEQNIINLASVHLDFEAAEAKAFKEIFPAINVIGCDFHWKQALRKNLKKHKLEQLYNCDQDLQVWYRKVWALSMAPVDSITNVWEHLLESIPDYDEEDEDDGYAAQCNKGLREFVNYIEKTWVGLLETKTRRQISQLKRKPPRFPYSTWNHHETYLEKKEVTSNQSESYNSSSKVISSLFLFFSNTPSYLGQSATQAINLVRPGVHQDRRVFVKDQGDECRQRLLLTVQPREEESLGGEEDCVPGACRHLPHHGPGRLAQQLCQSLQLILAPCHRTKEDKRRGSSTEALSSTICTLNSTSSLNSLMIIYAINVIFINFIVWLD